MITPLESAKEDVAYWRSLASRSESQKNRWLALSSFMGLFLAMQFCYWATTPDKLWEVDPRRPEIIFHYQLWAHRENTYYRWGKNDSGDPSWITVDEKGRPTGGYWSDAEYPDQWPGQ